MICSLSLCFINSLLTENACGANVIGHQAKTDNEKKLLYRLMHAARNAYPQQIENILKSGFNVNTTDENGRTALMIASASNLYYKYAIGALLHHGANVNIQDKNGVSPLMYAASQNESAALVNHLLINNATAELQDNGNWNAIMYAAKNGHTNVVATLLENKADLTLTNNDGNTAIDIAKQQDNMLMVEILENYNSKEL